MAARPKVVTYNVASLDGRITLAPGTLLLFGDERWSHVAGSDDGLERLRALHHPDVILEGSGSFVLEKDVPDPLPPADADMENLCQDYLPAEVMERSGHVGWFTVVGSRGRIRWAFKEWPDEAWRGWHMLVLVARSTPSRYLAYLRRESIPYLVTGEERLDLAEAIQRMGTALGVATVVSTPEGS